jgi:twitching motility protein PilT
MAGMTQLSELSFTDLYVRIDSKDISRYSPVPRRGVQPNRNLAVPDAFEDEIDVLRDIIRSQKKDDFSIHLDDMRLRGSRTEMSGEEVWASLRRLSLEPPTLDDLNFRSDILSEFRGWGTRSGLIVVGGATRAGKTTTMVGLLCDFLRTHGGVAVSIEDPEEYFLKGQHGDNGFCFQKPVSKDEEWGEALKTFLRWAPRYISLGEIRTPSAAKWLLRAATSGHLALCTVHGGSVEETLSAVLQMARSELGETAPNVLADGICAVIHQSITNGRPSVQILTTENSASDPVRVAIRASKLQTLGTYIEQQSAIRAREVRENKTGQRSDQAASQTTKHAAGQPALKVGQSSTKIAKPQNKGVFSWLGRR